MLKVKITDRSMETASIVSLILQAVDDEQLPDYKAGSHIDVSISNNLTRQYSLCDNRQDSSCYRIAILKDANSRGGSIKVHQDFKIGDEISISQPRNCFSLNGSDKRSILIAGGIGITPLMSMGYELENQGAEFELHYFCRNKEQAAFYDELKHASFSDKVHFYFDDKRTSNSEKLNSILKSPSGSVGLYTCGPQGFMDSVIQLACEHQWLAENIHKEFFSASESIQSDADKDFIIELAQSNQTIVVSAEQTALEALELAGVDVDSSCEQGICGACILNVISGTPDHRDNYFSDEEKALNNRFTPCCSRAKSEKLILDL